MCTTNDPIHARLSALGRGIGAMRLAMGEALTQLSHGFQRLGFPTLDSYAREALQRSGRWASESRVVARRLMALPLLREQLVGGHLTWSFVAFLVRATLASWRDSQPTNVAYTDVYLRDRWRCASPVCTSRNVTPHHIVFRAHGGTEARSNLVSLCERCHLELVHGNALRVTGDAERLTWAARGWQVVGRGVHLGGGRGRPWRIRGQPLRGLRLRIPHEHAHNLVVPTLHRAPATPG